MVVMRTRQAWGLLLGLGMSVVGCRTSPVPIHAEHATQLEPVPVEARLEAPRPGCDELGPVLLSVEPALLSLTCKDGFHECSGRTTLTVRSCAAAAIEVHEVLLSPAPPLRPPVVSVVRTVRIEPGSMWTMELELDQTGVYELSLGPVARHIGDPEISLGTTTLTVDNPAREQAVMACRECNGDWGRHGMLGIEGCVCRTHDGGTPCDDGADCESQCIERERGSGFRCSAFAREWGCYSYLPDGWSKQRHPKGTTEHRVCVD
jgi:hypothetical protein